MSVKHNYKHFKFPAFDDTFGVKLEPEDGERVLFEGEEFLFGSINDERTTHRLEERVIDDFDESEPVEATPQEESPVIQAKGVSFKEERKKYDELVNPGYRSQVSKQEQLSKNELNRRPFVASNRTAPPSYQREKLSKPVKTWERAASQNLEPRLEHYRKAFEEEKSKPLRQQYSGGVNRFRSRSQGPVKRKVEEEKREVKKPRFTEEELFQSMKKEKDSYLLMEVDPQQTSSQETPKEETKTWQTRAPRIVATQAKPVITGSNRNKVKPRQTLRNSLQSKDTPIYTGQPTVNFRKKNEKLDSGQRENRSSAPTSVGTKSTKELEVLNPQPSNNEQTTRTQRILTPESIKEEKAKDSRASVLTEKTKKKRALARDLTSLLQQDDASASKVESRLFERKDQ